MNHADAKARKMENVCVNDGTNAFIVLPSGQVATIDLVDLDAVNGYTWYSSGARNYVMTHRASNAENSSVLYLHRLLMKAGVGQVVDHINHDTLDNRRANLRLLTQQENTHNRRGPSPKSKTGVLGVSAHSFNGYSYYRARIRAGDKTHRKSFPQTRAGLIAASQYVETKRQELFPALAGAVPATVMGNTPIPFFNLGK